MRHAPLTPPRPLAAADGDDAAPPTASAMAPTSAPISAAAARRAIEWLIDLQAPDVSPQVQEAWRRWRAEHPDHERAWQRIESVNGRLRPLTDHSAAAVVTLGPPASRHRRRALGGLAAVLVVAGGSAWTVRQQPAWQRWTAEYRTRPGERRQLMLADGTALHLNTDSAVNVRYGAAERRVILLAGELLIETASDPAGRPFFVETPQGTAQALGTRFTVRSDEATTGVAVLEGRVRITPGRSAHDPSPVLEAGQQQQFDAETRGPMQKTETDPAAWADGLIVARRMRLAAFVAELARYAPQRLSCDPAVADWQVSGSFPLDDIGRILDTLTMLLPLELQTTTRFWGLQAAGIHVAARANAAPPEK